ncbi:MAG: hypothetical protein J2P27_11440, partial [Actinobacteria bacterium]|nr:hypothetical protein [Actinomycetota bacterium]
MDDTITCFVKGPASRYPSGYMWLFPAWFLIFSGAAIVVDELLTGGLPLWLVASEVGGLLVASSTAVCVLLTAKRLAFRANGHGIMLGSRTNTRRLRMRSVFLPWQAVSQVCLVP